MPGASVDRSIPSAKRRNLPPELGPDAIAILEGRSFMFSDAVGDVARGSIGGLVHADTRFLNHWILTVDGERLLDLAIRHGRPLFGGVLPDQPADGEPEPEHARDPASPDRRRRAA